MNWTAVARVCLYRGRFPTDRLLPDCAKEAGAVMSRTLWAWLRLTGGLAILAVVVWRLGSGPILDGLRTISVPALLAAAAIAVGTTACAAWRWQLVARGLGVDLSLRTAIAAYYRSQFLNTALPFGVLGDVHRAVDHGRDVGDVGRGLRAVAWERCAGQVVQTALALAVLVVLPSPVRSALPLVLAIAAAVLVTLVIAARVRPGSGRSRWARFTRAAARDLRAGVLARATAPGIVLASVLVVVGYTATFVIAARTVGVTASLATLVPLIMLILLAMSVPMNIGGWGPREGAAAWLFAAAGLGADRGVAASVAYGVLVFVASSPGAVVLAVKRPRRRPGADEPVEEPQREAPLVGTAHV